jgi:hypothetical protein
MKNTRLKKTLPLSNPLRTARLSHWPGLVTRGLALPGKLNFIFFFVFIFNGCSSIQTLPKENFVSGRPRTFNNKIIAELPGTRTAQLNLEVEKSASGSKLFHMLLTVVYVPVIHDAFEFPAGSSILVTIDGEPNKFSTINGSREDEASPELGLGKAETVRFDNIPIAQLQKMANASTVLVSLQGAKGILKARVPNEVLADFSNFLKKQENL